MKSNNPNLQSLKLLQHQALLRSIKLLKVSDWVWELANVLCRWSPWHLSSPKCFTRPAKARFQKQHLLLSWLLGVVELANLKFMNLLSVNHFDGLSDGPCLAHDSTPQGFPWLVCSAHASWCPVWVQSKSTKTSFVPQLVCDTSVLCCMPCAVLISITLERTLALTVCMLASE